MNGLDLIIVLLALVVAVVGWRRGLISGLFAMISFIGGALLGLIVAPRLLSLLPINETLRFLLTVVSVVAFAYGLQVFVSVFTRRLRRRSHRDVLSILDATGGALLNVLGFTLVVWLVGTVLLQLPGSGLSQQLRSSQVLSKLEAALPDQTEVILAEVNGLLEQPGVPELFVGLDGEPLLNGMGEPDPLAATKPAISAAVDSVVRVSGLAAECSDVLTGSGFVFAPGKVLTNAHVVAGVVHPTVQVGGHGKKFAASVVYFDAALDVAVLAAPELPQPPLEFTAKGERGEDGVIVGFPRGQDLRIEPARIQQQLQARGLDIYGEADVERQVWSLRTLIQHGNSGGPFLTTSGKVAGVVMASAIGDNTVGYALTAAQVQEAVQRGRGATTPVSSGVCLPG